MTVAYLLDTSVDSEVSRPAPSPNVVAWMKRNERGGLFISSLVIAELRLGIEKLRPRDARRADGFDAWLAKLITTFSDRILPVTEDVAQEWGRMQAGAGLPIIDGLMIATAAAHRMTFATRNVKDVARADVTVVNPFDG